MSDPNNLNDFRDQLAVQMYGLTPKQARGKHICIRCKDKVGKQDFRDENSWKEYAISAMCQSCQDIVFDPGDEAPDPGKTED